MLEYIHRFFSALLDMTDVLHCIILRCVCNTSIRYLTRCKVTATASAGTSASFTARTFKTYSQRLPRGCYGLAAQSPCWTRDPWLSLGVGAFGQRLPRAAPASSKHRSLCFYESGFLDSTHKWYCTVSVFFWLTSWYIHVVANGTISFFFKVEWRFIVRV